jgi:hypothetical protein
LSVSEEIVIKRAANAASAWQTPLQIRAVKGQIPEFGA